MNHARFADIVVLELGGKSPSRGAEGNTCYGVRSCKFNTIELGLDSNVVGLISSRSSVTQCQMLTTKFQTMSMRPELTISEHWVTTLQADSAASVRDA